MYTVFFFFFFSRQVYPADPSCSRRSLRDTLARQGDRPPLSFLPSSSPSDYLPWFLILQRRERRGPTAFSFSRQLLPSPFFNPLHLMRGISIGNLLNYVYLWPSIRRTSLLILFSINRRKLGRAQRVNLASKLVSFRRRFRINVTVFHPVPFDSYARVNEISLCFRNLW